jgi:hypothetical protein
MSQFSYGPRSAVKSYLSRKEGQSVPIKNLCSLPEVAQSLGAISIWTVRKHVARGNIRVVRLGKRVLVPMEELDRIRRDGLPSLRAYKRSSSEDAKITVLASWSDETVNRNITGMETPNVNHA